MSTPHTEPHFYVSTACTHEKHDGCRQTCKFCTAPCRCECHGDPHAMELTVEQHRQLHRELHRALDILLADWIGHQALPRPSLTPIMDLVKWSHAQTEDPEPIPGGPGHVPSTKPE